MTMTDPKQDVRSQFEAVARAIWNIRREHEDRCDMELEDMPANHEVWGEAHAAYTAALQSPAVRGMVEAKRKYDHLCAAFNDMKTSTSERFLECLGIEDDVCKPLDEILNTALRTLGAGHVE